MRHAVALAEETDMLWVQGEQWEHVAELVLARGRVEDGTAAFRTALERFDQKGATAPATRVRARLEANTAETAQEATGTASDVP
jgi:hypothetical protein